MDINISHFTQGNVIDTCAIWNVLSSLKLIAAAKSAKCYFSATGFVYYEALHKPRKVAKKEGLKLQQRLRTEMMDIKFFGDCSLNIADLQDVNVLNQRMRLGKGELSSIVFAKKSGLAFMTDDQKARKLGIKFIGRENVQTTPHLFGWLFYTRRLSDSDKSKIIHEHEQCGGPLKKYFEEAYEEALRCKCMETQR